MVEKLVRLPTWHQARMVYQQLGVTDNDLANESKFWTVFSPGEDLQQIYRRIGIALQMQEAKLL